jgi:1,4-alpha-glucan branching enzyme
MVMEPATVLEFPVSREDPPPLTDLRRTNFVLWLPKPVSDAPCLVIGVYAAGSPPTLAEERRLPLSPSGSSKEVWQLSAAECGLREGEVYHYWFETIDTLPYRDDHVRLACTDPCAAAVDWRLTRNPGEDECPAAVVRFRKGALEPTDPEVSPRFFEPKGDARDVDMARLPENHRLVIYELPTAWTKSGDLVDRSHVGVGSFRNVRALVDDSTPIGHYRNVRCLREESHLHELGVNALELLPPADTFVDRSSWGYSTSNYFAPDFDLGRNPNPDLSPEENAAQAPTAQTDFVELVRACHSRGIRFFYDAVMAFSQHDPYRFIDFLSYHVRFTGPGTPPELRDPEQASRDGFGGDLWKYAFLDRGYDPLAGGEANVHRARQHMVAHLLHWMDLYHVDGLRLDSVENYGNWDFAGDVRREARTAWNARWRAEGNGDSGADERFLVVGEELSVPTGLLSRLDGLWNEHFKRIARQVILGRNAIGEPSFEWSVRKLIDCRNLGFALTSQAVNYLGSHDVGGLGNERLYNYLHFNGVVFKEKPIKLAFACLLTAVGIPMILAGDEFADEHDIDIFNGDCDGRTPDDNKQLDPVNYERLDEPWRRDIFTYVSRLVHLRTRSDALAHVDTDFIHVDFAQGKRVLVWRRGRPDIDDPVVVVANFSDWGTADPLSANAEYRVPGFPEAPEGKAWWEVTAERRVELDRVGRESLFPWEAKVYELRKA